jgi:hypothetical protein
MPYKILHSFWELLAPEPPRKPPREPITRDFDDYDEIIAINEAKEVIILHMPKNYHIKF